MYFHVFPCTGTRISKDPAVDGNLAARDPLTPAPDHPQGAGGHAVHGVVRHSMRVADGDAKPAEVGADDVKVEPGGAGDVEDAFFTGVRSFVRI